MTGEIDEGGLRKKDTRFKNLCRCRGQDGCVFRKRRRVDCYYRLSVKGTYTFQAYD